MNLGELEPGQLNPQHGPANAQRQCILMKEKSD